MGTAASWIAKNGINGVVEVQSASFTGSLSAVSGKKVSLAVGLAVMRGSARTVNVEFDFAQLDASLKTFADAVVAIVKG